ncbi:MAG: DUF4349 domain-containing protein [Phycisphaerales bacterium]
MTDQLGDQLAHDLSRLTHWDDPSSQPWRTAVDQHQRHAARFSHWMLRPSGLGGIAAAVVLVFGFLIAGFSTDPERLENQSSDSPTFGSFAGQEAPGVAAKVDAADRSLMTFDVRAGAVSASLPPRVGERSAARSVPASPAPLLAQRLVARRSTLEILASDVAAAARRVADLASEARGEYVQESSIHGTPPNQTATVILRVASTRHAEVLAHIRELGNVAHESSTGEDVTDQAYDLDARLRNERRVEEELLKLIDSRPGAPLDDLFKVRSRLAEVRDAIERLQAQRDRLAGFVTLATISVIIRAGADADLVALESPNQFERAWDRGVKALSRSAAKFIEILVAGLIWWVVLALGAWFIVSRVARLARPNPNEPAPKL